MIEVDGVSLDSLVAGENIKDGEGCILIEGKRTINFPSGGTIELKEGGYIKIEPGEKGAGIFGDTEETDEESI